MQRPHIVCVLSESLFASVAGSYRLTVDNGQIRIVAPDLVGLHNAIMTLVQVATLEYLTAARAWLSSEHGIFLTFRLFYLIILTLSHSCSPEAGS
jgi:hypothetical protein